MDSSRRRDAIKRPSSSVEGGEQVRPGLREAALGAGLGLLALGVVLGAATRGAVAEPVRPGVAVTASARPAALAAVVPSTFVPPPAVPGLRRFKAALAALERRERREPVRVLWFGDSHTAADYWSGSVRTALGARFGIGGPGFLRLGVTQYRHDLATFGRSGRPRIEPVPPARRTQQGDGVFGLGGLRVSALREPLRMTVKLPRAALRGQARYRLLFDLPAGSSFTATLGQHALVVSERAQAQALVGSPILRIDLEGDVGDSFSVEPRGGRPRFYGVIVEGSEPGVVLDTLGIDGARIATALAWAEAPFVSEVRARAPELVVVAYGTNEAFDELRVEAYDRELSALLGRLQQAAPLADCLVLGPPDALGKAGESAPRIPLISAVYARVAQRLGCSFVSAQGLMGGPGSFARWQAESPPLARADRLHYTPKGYQRLGELLLDSLFPAELGLTRPASARISP